MLELKEFGVDHAELAVILNVTVAAARQIHSRARRLRSRGAAAPLPQNGCVTRAEA